MNSVPLSSLCEGCKGLPEWHICQHYLRHPIRRSTRGLVRVSGFGSLHPQSPPLCLSRRTPLLVCSGSPSELSSGRLSTSGNFTLRPLYRPRAAVCHGFSMLIESGAHMIYICPNAESSSLLERDVLRFEHCQSSIHKKLCLHINCLKRKIQPLY